MVKSVEIIRKDLSLEQIRNIYIKLNESGFYVSDQDQIHVKNPKENHPKNLDWYLPIGYISTSYSRKPKNYVELVNLNKKFPEDYHSKLREIFNSV